MHPVCTICFTLKPPLSQASLHSPAGQLCPWHGRPLVHTLCQDKPAMLTWASTVAFPHSILKGAPLYRGGN